MTAPGDVASFSTTTPGIYSVIITNTNTGCSSLSVSGIVVASFPPLAATASSTSYFAEGQIIIVDVNPRGNYEYQIDNGAFQSNNEFINFSSGWHHITVKNDCGTLPPIDIRIVDYPKFFTPNGDGFNDSWNITDLSDQAGSKIFIFDRYGKLLKEIFPQGIGWDGTFNGKLLPATDYWFKVYFRESGADKEFKAHFTLKR
jgi:gliding motility-associated-like protein